MYQAYSDATRILFELISMSADGSLAIISCPPSFPVRPSKIQCLDRSSMGSMPCPPVVESIHLPSTTSKSIILQFTHSSRLILGFLIQ